MQTGAAAAPPGQRAELRQILPVHGDEIVEIHEVRGRHLAGACLERDSVPAGYFSGPPIGSLTDVPCTGSGAGIHPVVLREATGAQEALEYAFGERRATDVAEAYEQNPGGALVHS